MTQKNRIQNDEARSLTDAFQELRQSQARTVELNPYAKKHRKAKKENHTVKIKCSKKEKDLSSKFEVKTLEKKSPFHKAKQKKNKLNQTIFSKKANDKKYTKTPSGRIRTKGVSVFTLSLSAFCFVVLFANYNFATNTSYIEPTISTEEFEANQKAYNLEEIIQTNISVTKTKNKSTEEREIPFHTTYRDNSFLPKGEQVITQPGTVGREKVTVVRTYENDQLIEEKCISSTMLQEPIEQIVDVGTSEFLAKYKVHIGDTMYLTKDSILKESANSSSKNIITIKKNLDVQLLELSGDWCKVSYNGTQGYIEASALTSATINPEMVEKITKVVKDTLYGTDKILIAKLTGWNTDIVRVCKVAENNGADAITVSNIFPGMGYYTGLTEKKNGYSYKVGEPLLGNFKGGYTGVAMLPATLLIVNNVANSVNIPVIATGGCMSSNDAMIQAFLAGASAIASATFYYDSNCRTCRDFSNDLRERKEILEKFVKEKIVNI